MSISNNRSSNFQGFTVPQCKYNGLCITCVNRGDKMWSGAFGIIIWASTRQTLSSGFPTKRVSNQSPQLPATETSFACSKFTNGTFQTANNKGADQDARMRRLVCACVIRNTPKTCKLSRVEANIRLSCHWRTYYTLTSHATFYETSTVMSL